MTKNIKKYFKMKKLIISIIAVFIFCENIHAQAIWTQLRSIYVLNTTVVDSGNIRILYAFNATDISKQETYDDLQRLEIGKNISKYYSYFNFNNDSLNNVENKKIQHNVNVVRYNFNLSETTISDKNKENGVYHRLGVIGKKETWDEYIYSEYFKDYAKNVLTHYIRKPYGLISSFQYSEDIPVQDWEIAEDTLSIAGYLCQKATCTFRGRNFTAWFTMDIPVQNGPWKFGGLPGLILKVYDDDKLYEFECVKIESFNEKYLIEIGDYKGYEKTDRQKSLKFIKRLYDDYYNVARIRRSDGKVWQKIPYNPLELE